MNNGIVASIVKKVFPEGTELCLNANGGPPESRFWMIPGKRGEPRWILPHEPKFAIPFLKQWRPYDFRSRIKWKLLMLAYRGKKLNHVSGVVPLRINVPEDNNWDHLGWALPKPPVPVIYVGTPGPNRKAVPGLIDSQKRKVTFIGKTALGPSAGLAINHEVDVLDALAKEKPGQAPLNLFNDREQGIAIQEFFPGTPTGRTLTRHHVQFLANLALPGETTSLREVAEDFEYQIKALKTITPEALNLFEQVLQKIDDPSPLNAVWVHGDFAPWNIKKTPNRPLRVIDWEAGSRKGLPLFDLVFFRSMQMFLFKENALFPKSFGRPLSQYLERLNIAPAKTHKIIQACIVQDWLRCYRENNLPRANFLMSQLHNLIREKA